MKQFIDKLIERLEEELKLADEVKEKCARENPLMFDNAKGYSTGIANAKDIVNQLAEEYKTCIKSSCSNCEVYDTEKHYCPKWCEVIKGTVAEIEENHNGWIPCSERLPEKSGKYLVTQKRYSLDDRFYKRPISTEVDYVEFNAIDNTWCRARFFKVIAWQPLPEPYQTEGE